MADRSPAPDTPELRERWGGFEFNESYRARADKAIARYPEGRQRSAVMPASARAMMVLSLIASSRPSPTS